MPWHAIKDEAKISAIVKHLISRQRELKILIDGEKETFRARILKLSRIQSENGEEAQLVIQRLDHESQKELVRSASDVWIEFVELNRFAAACRGAHFSLSLRPLLILYPPR